MKFSSLLALVACLGACSKLPVVGDGVVALQIQVPTSLTLKQGDSVALQATALNASGDAVDVPITWLTPDTTVSVTALGVVHAIDSTGTGRVQATVGTLHSDFITFTLAKAAAASIRDR